MKRSPNGFTLTELIIVIGIVAVLVAMMVPVFARARDKARQSHCYSNQRQLVMAFNNYASDWEGTLPRWWTPEGGPKTNTLGLAPWQRDWAIDTLPYVQNERLYVCPNKPLLIRGYGQNLWLASPDGFPLSDIPFPTRTALFSEIAGGRPLVSAYDFVDRSTPEGWPIDVKFQFDPRHNEGANIAYVDGHVKWVPSNLYTRWPAHAGNYRDLTPVSMNAGGTPVGTHWWPSKDLPPGD